MDFVTGLSLLMNCKDNSYDAISVMVYLLIKMIYYEHVKTKIDVAGPVNVIINIVVR